MNLSLVDVSFAYKSKAFSPHRVFDSLNLSIKSGECVAVTGEEGTGKSTLLQLVNALLKPDAGKVLVDDQDIWAHANYRKELRCKTGFAFQFPEQQFFCETVLGELLFTLRNIGAERADSRVKCIRVLEDLGLDESYLSRSPFSLSMGEARRVALASLLAHDPDSFLFDEPTAGLDGFGIDTVKTLLLNLRSAQKTILLVSHDVELVSSVASRVVVLEGGRVAKDLPISRFVGSTEGETTQVPQE